MESGKRIYDINKDVFKNGSEEQAITVIETIQDQAWETACKHGKLRSLFYWGKSI